MNRNKIITFICVTSQQHMFLLLFGDPGQGRRSPIRVSGGTHNDKSLFIIPRHTKSDWVLCYTLQTVRHRFVSEL